ncbi:MAG TPA: phosphoribosyltransferase [Gemmatimonadaceae bacterium]
MKITRLEGIWVERACGVAALCGRASAAADVTIQADELLVGLETDGLLAASLVALLHRRSAALLRWQTKNHGTENQLDGALSSASFAVVCTPEQLSHLESIVRRGVLQCGRVITVESRRPSGRLSPFVADATFDPHVGDVDLAAHASLLSGRSYLLASGETRSMYYDTLPAAHTWEVVMSACRQGRDAFSGHTHVVGIALGGIYLGVAAALLAGHQPVAADPREAISPGVLSAGTACLLDDFVSTGGSFGAAVRALDVMSVAGSTLFSLYGIRGRYPRASWLRVAYELAPPEGLFPHPGAHDEMP